MKGMLRVIKGVLQKNQFEFYFGTWVFWKNNLKMRVIFVYVLKSDNFYFSIQLYLKCGGKCILKE